MIETALTRAVRAPVIGPSQLSVVKNHMLAQEKHHRGRSSEEEFAALLEKSGVEFDPHYLFG